jgi:hypothetical protein
MSTRGKRIVWGVAILLSVLLLLFMVAEFRLRPRAQSMRTQLLLDSISAASSQFKAHMNRWPSSASELVSNSAAIAFVYPPRPWRDAWDRTIVYEPFTTNSGFGRAMSYGRDGKPGGLGLDADIEVKFP